MTVGGHNRITERWRYLDSGPRSGMENMAVDEALLESHIAGDCPPTFRIYTWQPPAVSLGHFQRAESSVDFVACQRLGIDIVRRPTGGRAILHTDKEVTFSLVVSAERLGKSSVMEAYRRIASGILAGLQSLGLDARLVERSSPDGAFTAQDPACFAVKARCDLVVGKSKLVGSAQVQRKGFILQQNSLPLTIKLSDWNQIFLRKTNAPSAIGLWEAAGRQLTYHEVAQALRHGFEQAFGVVLARDELIPREIERVKELVSNTLVEASSA